MCYFKKIYKIKIIWPDEICVASCFPWHIHPLHISRHNFIFANKFYFFSPHLFMLDYKIIIYSFISRRIDPMIFFSFQKLFFFRFNASFQYIKINTQKPLKKNLNIHFSCWWCFFILRLFKQHMLHQSFYDNFIVNKY